MIETATQSGKSVYVYGNGNHILFVEPGELVGYTSYTVSVRWNNKIRTFDEKHHLLRYD